MPKLKVIFSMLVLTALTSPAFAGGPSAAQVATKSAEVNALVNQSAATLTHAQRYAILKLLGQVEAIALGQQPLPPPPTAACAQEDAGMMQATFVKIKAFAYSASGLNLSDSAATNYASEWIQGYACASADSFMQDFKMLKDFAFASSGLNYSSDNSVKFASDNVNRQCFPGVNPQPDFKKAYDFAYSSQGLNLSSDGSTRYALQQIIPKYFSCLH